MGTPKERKKEKNKKTKCSETGPGSSCFRNDDAVLGRSVSCLFVSLREKKNKIHTVEKKGGNSIKNGKKKKKKKSAATCCFSSPSIMFTR
jgi:hypothetical protein